MRTIATLALGLLVALLFANKALANPLVIETDAKNHGNIAFWLESPLQRVFPRTEPGSTNLHLLAARHSRISFQVCLKNRRTDALNAECQILGADDLKPQIRYVGLVPILHFTPHTPMDELDGVEHLPGLVPDPLWPLTKVNSIGPNESRSFWITLNIPANAQPGPREFKVKLSVLSGSKSVELPVHLDIAELVVQPRKDFPVIHWWRGEATWDYYKTGMFEDQRWWDITKAQLENMLAHGSDVVYVPVFFNRRETFKRPCQLLTINEPAAGKYEFDWALVKRFTDLCRQIGFKKFEWPHLWIYWGVNNPMRLYTKKGGNYVMLWPPDTDAFSDTYLNFLKQFLPKFKAFLDQENLLPDSYFHLSDEPSDGQHLVNYKRARQVLRDLAPWMKGKVMDALSHVEYGREGLTDIPIPLVSSAQAYIDEKIPHWVYYCCTPQDKWLNRFMDTPLSKIRMSGMLFYKLGARGFLHWGFNYWHKIESEEMTDPFNDGSAAAWPGIPWGDPFVVYPGPDGQPMDSTRWEIFAEALQDYAILQSAGIKPDDAMLAELKTYADFPKNQEWIQKAMEKILKPSAKTASAGQ